jgi:hypothetical protein
MCDFSDAVRPYKGENVRDVKDQFVDVIEKLNLTTFIPTDNLSADELLARAKGHSQLNLDGV